MKCPTHTDTHTDVGGEALGSVAGQIADDLEVVQLRLQDHDDGDDDHVQDQDQYFNQ